MVRRLHAVLPTLATVALLAGCGSSSSSSGSSGATSPTPSTSQTGPSSTATTGSTATTPSPASGAGAVADCKRGIRALPHLKQSTTEKLEAICQKAAGGDAEAKRKAAEEACRELVNASPLPAGEARDRALAACKNAGGPK